LPFLFICRGFCLCEFARGWSVRPSRIIEGDISGELGERFHHSNAVLRVPHLHPNMKTLNWHRHGSICTNPANSATCRLRERYGAAGIQASEPDCRSCEGSSECGQRASFNLGEREILPS